MNLIVFFIKSLPLKVKYTKYAKICFNKSLLKYSKAVKILILSELFYGFMLLKAEYTKTCFKKCMQSS